MNERIVSILESTTNIKKEQISKTLKLLDVLFLLLLGIERKLLII